jgi:hypothetical protein
VDEGEDLAPIKVGVKTKTSLFFHDQLNQAQQVEDELLFYCLVCLQSDYYFHELQLIDGTFAKVRMCISCHLRMEFQGTV